MAADFDLQISKTFLKDTELRRVHSLNVAVGDVVRLDFSGLDCDAVLLNASQSERLCLVFSRHQV